MPREPERARRPQQNYNIVTLVPGWLKNKIIDLAEANDTSVQQWIATVLLDAVRKEEKLPGLKEGARLPTPAEILKFIPLSQRDNTPPIAESGMAEKINKPYFTELNEKYNISKINNKLTGTAMDRRDFAC